MFTPNYKQDKIADLFHEEILPGTFPLCYNEKQFTWALRLHDIVYAET
jgi:hypothetical protein